VAYYTALVAEGVVGSGVAVAVVAGVVLVHSSGGSTTADHDAIPVVDFQIPA
jgi:hypothetical protein